MSPEKNVTPIAPAVRRRRRAFAHVESLEFRKFLTTTTWIGASGGDWSTGANWDNGVPTATVDAVIPASISVTVSQAGQAAQSLTVGAGDVVTVSGGLATAGNVALSGGSSLVITSSGSFDLQGGGSVTSPDSTGSITNSGTFEKTTGTSNSTVSVPYNTTATSAITAVDASAGTLILGGGGTQQGGTYNIAAGTTVDLTGGSSPTLSGNFTGTGTGSLSLSSGTVTIAPAGATFKFPTKMFNWTGGTLEGAGATVTNTGTLNFGGGTLNIDQGLTVINTGFIFHTAGNVNISNGAQFFNGQTGIYEAENPTDIAYTTSGGGATFINNGLIAKILGASTLSFNIPFTNIATTGVASSGVVSASTGQISLNSGGTFQGGSLITSTGSAINLTQNGTTLTISGTITGAGQGRVYLNDGGSVVVSGTATLQMPGVLLHWQGGTISGGTLINTSEINVTASDATLDGGITLDNRGFLLVLGVLRVNNGSQITNESAGTIELVDAINGSVNDGVQITSTSGAASLTNAGTIIHDTGAGTGSILIPLTNAATGTINVTTGTVSLGNNGAYVGGTFVVASGSLLDLTGGSSPLYAGTFTGSGAGVVSLASGSINVAGGGATFNFPSGMFQWTGGSIVGGNTLTNVGSITINGTVDLTGSATALANAATVSLTGDLRVSNGAAVSNSGYLLLQNGSSITTLGGGANLSNAGTVQLVAGSAAATVAVPYSSAANSVTQAVAGTLTFSGGGTSTGGGYAIAAGAAIDPTGGNTVTWSGNYTGTGTGTLVFSQGQLDAGSNLALNFPQGLLNWSGGTWSSGTLTNTGYITLSGSAATLDGGITVINNGTFLQPGTSLQVNDASTFQNNGTVVATGAAAYTTAGGGATFVNAGLFQLASGGTSAQFLIPTNLTSAGTLEADVGTITLAGGGASTGGNFVVAAGAVVNLTGGNAQSLGGTYTGSGAGTVSFSSGSITPGANLTLNFPVGLFQWTGGAFSGGTVTNTGSIAISGTEEDLNNGAVLVNSGSIALSAGQLTISNGSLLANGTSGTFSFTGSSSIGTLGGAASFGNSGLVTSSAPATIAVTYSNLGTTQVTANTLTLSGQVAQISGNSILAGTWTLASGATLSTPNTPSITSNAGTINLEGANATWSSIAPLATNSGTFSLSGGAAYTTTGDFDNTGNLLISGASMSVAGLLTEAGTYTAGLALSGGIPTFPSFSAESVVLSGTLAGSLASGVLPTPDQTYVIIHNRGSSPISGTFANQPEGSTVTLGGHQFRVTYLGAAGADVAAIAGRPAAAIVIADSGNGSYIQGQAYTLTITITNSGTDVSAAGTATVFLSPTPTYNAATAVQLDTLSVPAIATGASSVLAPTFSFSNTQAIGTYYAIVRFDPTPNNTGLTTQASNALLVSRKTADIHVGGLNPTFGTAGVATTTVAGVSFTVDSTAVQANGQVIVGGTTSAGALVLARFNTDGSLDTTFGTSGVTQATVGTTDKLGQVLVQANGSILVAATVDNSLALLRFTSTGAADATFGTSGSVVKNLGSLFGSAGNSVDVATSLAVATNGEIYVAGSTTPVGGNANFAVARFTAAGVLDSGFNSIGYTTLDFAAGADVANAILIQKNGQVVLVGSATVGGTSEFAAARFNTNGSLDTKFATKGKFLLPTTTYDAAYAAALQSNGYILIGGIHTTASTGTSVPSLIRITTAGKLDTKFGAGGIARTALASPYAAIDTISITSLGSVLVGVKTATSLADAGNNALGLTLLRYTTTGKLDAGFNRTGQNVVLAPETTISTNVAPTDPNFAAFAAAPAGFVTIAPSGQILTFAAQPGASTTAFQIASIVPDAADLAAAAVTLTPIKGAIVGTVTKGTATVILTNEGTTPYTAKSIPLSLGIAGDTTGANIQTVASVASGGTIAPGASKKVTVKFSFPSLATASYYLAATVTSPAGVFDLNPYNNLVFSAATTAVQAPFVDLSITFAKPPTGLTANKRGSVSVNITNLGNVAAKGSDLVTLFSTATNSLTGSPIQLAQLANARLNLAAGRSARVTLSVTPPTAAAANPYIAATVSFTGTPAETILSNNSIFSATPIAG
jgi:uncharacterized delta-60 repeat protein